MIAGLLLLLLVGVIPSVAQTPTYPAAATYDSPSIAALHKAYESGEAGVVEHFWKVVAKRGAPLIEPVPEDKEFSFATFLWRGDSGTKNASPLTSPVLAHTCLITGDVRRLVDFYQPVLQIKAKWSGNDYAEFTTGASVLAIFSFAAQEKYIPGSAQPAANHSMILEFEVADVDEEYRRLRGTVKTWVKPPTTQPWGTRSIYFRDPDGNLVDFYAPAKSK
jgi:catechol 2,3-dioxygenase-like lactoylglutathione lyase family enzyme